MTQGAGLTPPAAAAAQQGQEPLPTPSPTPELSLSVDWRALKKTNHYVRAWLYCEGTNLNYPVVQYRDNEYFLGRNFEREKDDAGTLFFDCENVLSNGLENWIIYGHRRNDKSMFGALARYAKEDYYRTHPVMYLLTEEQTYRVEVFACRTVHAYPEYFTLWFQDERAFGKYIDKAIERSYWKPEFAVGTEYPILTLATCSTYGNDAVVPGRAGVREVYRQGDRALVLEAGVCCGDGVSDPDAGDLLDLRERRCGSRTSGRSGSISTRRSSARTGSRSLLWGRSIRS